MISKMVVCLPVRIAEIIDLLEVKLYYNVTYVSSTYVD